MDLLTSTQVWDFNGSTYRVYYDGTMETFKGRHIPYALSGVFIGLLCNILPLVLILFYSFRKTHVILNCLPLSVEPCSSPSWITYWLATRMEPMAHEIAAILELYIT